MLVVFVLFSFCHKSLLHFAAALSKAILYALDDSLKLELISSMCRMAGIDLCSNCDAVVHEYPAEIICSTKIHLVITTFSDLDFPNTSFMVSDMVPLSSIFVEQQLTTASTILYSSVSKSFIVVIKLK